MTNLVWRDTGILKQMVENFKAAVEGKQDQEPKGLPKQLGLLMGRRRR